MLRRETVTPDTLELLKSLMQKDYLQQFVLVGGTALALQIGHRRSIDLDFFTIHDFNTPTLLPNLEKDYTIQIEDQLPQTLICSVNGIKVDFIRFQYAFLHPIVTLEGIRMLSVEDIAPMKLDAITGRGSKKDFYDLYFLLQQYDLKTLFSFYTNTYPHQTTFHVARSLAYFDDAEAMPDPEVMDKKVTWSKVKKAIVKEIQKL